jgi:hypothetical protein
MAKHGITDYGNGVEKFLYDLYGHLQNAGHFMGQSAEDFLLEKVRLRAKEFNTIINSAEEEEKRIAIEKAAAEYRKASNGG